MIYAVYQIGKYLSSHSAGTLDPLNEIVDSFNEKDKHLFIIEFIKNNDYSINFKKISYAQVNHTNEMKLKYLYKKGSGARGADKTPTSKITEPSRTLKVKIATSVKNSLIKAKENNFSAEEIDFFSNLHEEFIKQFEQINNDLLTAYANYTIPKGESSVLTITINGKFIGEMPTFRKLLVAEGGTDYFNKYGLISKDYNKTCCVCKASTEEVWGFVNTYNSFSVDKPGMVSGGFDQEKSWRNYPVCSECARILNIGKNYIKDNLNFRFCGFNYFVLPKLIIESKGDIEKVLTRLRRYKDFTLQQQGAEWIQRTEERIFKELQDKENKANFDILFYKEEKSGKVFRILLHLEDITPTRFSQIIEANKDVDDESLRKYKLFEYKIKDKQTNNVTLKRVEFSFGLIKEVFPNNKIEGNFDKSFLEILGNIITGRIIEWNLLLKNELNHIRSRFLNKENIDFKILSLYKIFLFLKKLNLMGKEGRKLNSMTLEKKFEDFFAENGDFFNDATKKAVFLEGILCTNVLYVQRSERKCGFGDEPFRSKLNGLKINERIAKKLLPEMINKLDEYKRNAKAYSDLAVNISEYMLKSDFKKHSVDELSFYFVLGMSLANKIQFREEETINKEGEN